VDARGIRVPTTLVAAHPDLLVPLEQMRQLAKQLGSHAKLIEIVSPYGHDAFLHEQQRFTALLDTALTSGVSP
jgi:homoserine acetyltransferase